MLLAELSVVSCRVVILPLNRTFPIRWDFRQDSVYLSGGNWEGAEGAAAQADQRPPANHLLSAVQWAAQAIQLESI